MLKVGSTQMKKLLLSWWPLWVWVASVALILLAAPYVSFKLFQFLFLFWIGVSIVGFIPVGASLLTDIEDAMRRKQIDPPFVGPRFKREFDWKRMRMVEIDTQPEICKGSVGNVRNP